MQEKCDFSITHKRSFLFSAGKDQKQNGSRLGKKRSGMLHIVSRARACDFCSSVRKYACMNKLFHLLRVEGDSLVLCSTYTCHVNFELSRIIFLYLDNIMETSEYQTAQRPE